VSLIVHAVEAERDRLVREHRCPVCHVDRTHLCTYGKTEQGNNIRSSTSHEGRYRKAVRYGKVPALAGMAK
jgi:hypothetical protein